MESVVRGVAVYGLLLVIFRITGKRALGQITTFDLVLLLIISEAIQNGMVGAGHSVTNALVLIVTLVVVDVGLTWLKTRAPAVERWLEGAPTVIVEDGRPLHDRLARWGVDVGDVLRAARNLQGLERLDQVKYAVLERNGDISIIPRERSA